MIGADLHGTEIDTDLGSEVSGKSMTDTVRRLPPQRLDGFMADTGISGVGRPADTIAINYFGTVLQCSRGFIRC